GRVRVTATAFDRHGRSGTASIEIIADTVAPATSRAISPCIDTGYSGFTVSRYSNVSIVASDANTIQHVQLSLYGRDITNRGVYFDAPSRVLRAVTGTARVDLEPAWRAGSTSVDIGYRAIDVAGNAGPWMHVLVVLDDSKVIVPEGKLAEPNASFGYGDVFRGRLVDSFGLPRPSEPVSILVDGKLLGRCSTNASGHFAFVFESIDVTSIDLAVTAFSFPTTASAGTTWYTAAGSPCLEHATGRITRIDAAYYLKAFTLSKGPGRVGSFRFALGDALESIPDPGEYEGIQLDILVPDAIDRDIFNTTSHESITLSFRDVNGTTYTFTMDEGMLLDHFDPAKQPASRGIIIDGLALRLMRVTIPFKTLAMLGTNATGMYTRAFPSSLTSLTITGTDARAWPGSTGAGVVPYQVLGLAGVRLIDQIGGYDVAAGDGSGPGSMAVTIRPDVAPARGTIPLVSTFTIAGLAMDQAWTGRSSAFTIIDEYPNTTWTSGNGSFTVVDGTAMLAALPHEEMRITRVVTTSGSSQVARVSFAMQLDAGMLAGTAAPLDTLSRPEASLPGTTIFVSLQDQLGTVLEIGYSPRVFGSWMPGFYAWTRGMAAEAGLPEVIDGAWHQFDVDVLDWESRLFVVRGRDHLGGSYAWPVAGKADAGRGGMTSIVAGTGSSNATVAAAFTNVTLTAWGSACGVRPIEQVPATMAAPSLDLPGGPVPATFDFSGEPADRGQWTGFNVAWGVTGGIHARVQNYGHVATSITAPALATGETATMGITYSTTISTGAIRVRGFAPRDPAGTITIAKGAGTHVVSITMTRVNASANGLVATLVVDGIATGYPVLPVTEAGEGIRIEVPGIDAVILRAVTFSWMESEPRVARSFTGVVDIAPVVVTAVPGYSSVLAGHLGMYPLSALPVQGLMLEGLNTTTGAWDTVGFTLDTGLPRAASFKWIGTSGTTIPQVRLRALATPFWTGSSTIIATNVPSTRANATITTTMDPEWLPMDIRANDTFAAGIAPWTVAAIDPRFGKVDWTGGALRLTAMPDGNKTINATTIVVPRTISGLDDAVALPPAVPLTVERRHATSQPERAWFSLQRATRINATVSLLAGNASILTITVWHGQRDKDWVKGAPLEWFTRIAVNGRVVVDIPTSSSYNSPLSGVTWLQFELANMDWVARACDVLLNGVVLARGVAIGGYFTDGLRVTTSPFRVSTRACGVLQSNPTRYYTLAMPYYNTAEAVLDNIWVGDDPAMHVQDMVLRVDHATGASIAGWLADGAGRAFVPLHAETRALPGWRFDVATMSWVRYTTTITAPAIVTARVRLANFTWIDWQFLPVTGRGLFSLAVNTTHPDDVAYLPPGTHDVELAFPGNDRYAPATMACKIVVSRAPARITYAAPGEAVNGRGEPDSWYWTPSRTYTQSTFTTGAGAPATIMDMNRQHGDPASFSFTLESEDGRYPVANAPVWLELSISPASGMPGKVVDHLKDAAPDYLALQMVDGYVPQIYNHPVVQGKTDRPVTFPFYNASSMAWEFAGPLAWVYKRTGPDGKVTFTMEDLPVKDIVADIAAVFKTTVTSLDDVSVHARVVFKDTFDWTAMQVPAVMAGRYTSLVHGKGVDNYLSGDPVEDVATGGMYSDPMYSSCYAEGILRLAREDILAIVGSTEIVPVNDRFDVHAMIVEADREAGGTLVPERRDDGAGWASDLATNPAIATLEILDARAKDVVATGPVAETDADGVVTFEVSPATIGDDAWSSLWPGYYTARVTVPGSMYRMNATVDAGIVIQSPFSFAFDQPGYVLDLAGAIDGEAVIYRGNPGNAAGWSFPYREYDVPVLTGTVMCRNTSAFWPGNWSANPDIEEPGYDGVAVSVWFDDVEMDSHEFSLPVASPAFNESLAWNFSIPITWWRDGLDVTLQVESLNNATGKEVAITRLAISDSPHARRSDRDDWNLLAEIGAGAFTGNGTVFDNLAGDDGSYTVHLPAGNVAVTSVNASATTDVDPTWTWAGVKPVEAGNRTVPALAIYHGDDLRNRDGDHDIATTWITLTRLLPGVTAKVLDAARYPAAIAPGEVLRDGWQFPGGNVGDSVRSATVSVNGTNMTSTRIGPGVAAATNVLLGEVYIPWRASMVLDVAMPAAPAGTRHAVTVNATCSGEPGLTRAWTRAIDTGSAAATRIAINESDWAPLAGKSVDITLSVAL
ncbi:MAG: hypothetical protein GYA24_02850, partial [Candidatus Lokiarchaeota archaeon]|nr:hypothetical protein [Candidatus Lokiarchaeota archaeon]